jgi:hypothetical protein
MVEPLYFHLADTQQGTKTQSGQWAQKDGTLFIQANTAMEMMMADASF